MQALLTVAKVECKRRGYILTNRCLGAGALGLVHVVIEVPFPDPDQLEEYEDETIEQMIDNLPNWLSLGKFGY